MSSSWVAAIAILGRAIIQIELQHDTTDDTTDDDSTPTGDGIVITDHVIEADGDHGLIVDRRMGYQPRRPA